ncbi:caspase family protein [Coraliomargarita algicola]|uniref:Caspase family protein n=1 Tax=Coraliomargarita algicola TaxID=3092156 RepID=A0ABZ0RKW8_9BACT|nr:caspase family protein [Coraliomargarita sp. J2-16]WPJ95904.1 caspase family protein [Coraliomargarita sp. J2-16]
MKRLQTLILCIALFLQLTHSAIADTIIDRNASLDTLSPQRNYALTSGQFGTVISSAKTLLPKFIVSDAHTQIAFFSNDDRFFYYVDPVQGFYRLNLATGKSDRLSDLKEITFVYESPESNCFYLVTSEGSWSKSTAYHIYRLDPGKATKRLTTVTPDSAPAIGAFQLLSHIESGRILILANELTPAKTHMQSDVYGDTRVIELEMESGKLTTLNTFPQTTQIEYNHVRPTKPNSTVLEFTNTKGNYHLLDPYKGEVLRIIDVPGVEFELGRAGMVIAQRIIKEEGKERFFIDYLESGSLKTLQNFEVADKKEMRATRIEGDYLAEEATQWLSRSGAFFQVDKQSGNELQRFSLDYSRIRLLGHAPQDANKLLLAVQKDYGSDTQLVHYDLAEKTEIKEVARPSKFKFREFAFHPSKPEFFATDENDNVHFFRITRSSIQHSLRGQTAVDVAYSADGASILSRVDPEDILYRYAPEVFPHDPERTKLGFATNPPPSILPNYSNDFLQSASQKWLLQLDSFHAYLYEYQSPKNGLQIDQHGTPRDNDGRIEQSPVHYSFAPDDSRLYQLKTQLKPDATPSSSVLSAFALDGELSDYPQASWTTPLDGPHRHFAGFRDTDQAIRLFNASSGEIEWYQPSTGALLERRSINFKLSEAALNPTDFRLIFNTHYEPSKELLVFYNSEEVHCLQFTQKAPRYFAFNDASGTSAIHFPAGADLMIRQTDAGTLNFHSLAPDSNHDELASLTFYNGGSDYLIQSNNGHFDATASIQAKGSYQQGIALLPLSQIFDKAYEPTLLPKLLAGIQLPEQALEFEQIERAPTAQIRHQPYISEQMTLKLSAGSTIGNLAELNLYQNEKLIKSFEVAGSPTSFHEFPVQLIPGLNAFKLVAINVNGIQSIPALAELQFGDPDESDRNSHKLHILVVGINEYQNPKYSLNYALPDASSILETLKTANAALYDEVSTYAIFDHEATADNILAQFDSIRATAKPQDTFIFYFAGHGVMSQENDLFYLVPTNVTQIYGASDTLKTNGISSFKLKQLAETIQAQKQVFILDACNSGGALEVFTSRGASQEKALAQLARATGTHWLTASSSSQFATEFEELGHGAFTYALLAGLNGAADSGDARVSINELKAYLESELPRITAQHKGTAQYPTSYGYGRDFPVALKNQ